MSKKYLRRYTELSALIYLLSTRRLTLLDPESWDDSNDSYYLSLYKKKKRLKCVLALCFTETDERYNYWKVYGGGPSGVCIQFNRTALDEIIKRQYGLQMRSVEYVKLAELRARKLQREDLPFIKRYAFEHECEHRMIFESKREELTKLDFGIPISGIDKITLSPWIHPSLFKSVKATLRSIDGCRRLTISRSTLIGNEEWKELGDGAV